MSATVRTRISCGSSSSSVLSAKRNRSCKTVWIPSQATFVCLVFNRNKPKKLMSNRKKQKSSSYSRIPEKQGINRKKTKTALNQNALAKAGTKTVRKSSISAAGQENKNTSTKHNRSHCVQSEYDHTPQNDAAVNLQNADFKE